MLDFSKSEETNSSNIGWDEGEYNLANFHLCIPLKSQITFFFLHAIILLDIVLYNPTCNLFYFHNVTVFHEKLMFNKKIMVLIM